MPDLASLEALLAVARTGSLTAAARDVGITQQAVSARIAALESRTGVRLVSRTPHGSQLTPSGQVAVEWADRLLQLAHEVETGFASLRATSRRRLRVSASLTVAEQLLPGWLVSFGQDARRRGEPAAEIVLTAANSDHVVDRVRTGAADLGFVEGPRVPGDLRSRVIAHDELALVVEPGHPWARRTRPLPIATLAATPLVTREPGSGTREFLTAALASALGPERPPVEPTLELSTAAAIRVAVLAGSAPAVLSRLAVGDDLAAGRLREVAVAGLDLRRPLRAIWSGGRTPPAGAARDLLAHVASRARA